MPGACCTAARQTVAPGEDQRLDFRRLLDCSFCQLNSFDCDRCPDVTDSAPELPLLCLVDTVPSQAAPCRPALRPIEASNSTADVTYIPMACGFLYLVAIIDWASRAVSGMAAVEHQRCELPRGGARGGAASVRKAADFQYRSGLHFHRRGFRRQACGGRRRDFDGWTRPFHGQRAGEITP